jgi:DNA-binding MarR family transcriptional regulator
MIGAQMSTAPDPAELAAELRLVLGQLIRRIRAESSFPMPKAVVLGRLDRQGPQTVSDLAAAERMRPQSMAQTVADMEQAGLVERRGDPADRRRMLVEMTQEGRELLEANRRERVGWLAEGIEQEFSTSERAALANALPLLRRLTER